MISFVIVSRIEVVSLQGLKHDDETQNVVS